MLGLLHLRVAHGLSDALVGHDALEIMNQVRLSHPWLVAEHPWRAGCSFDAHPEHLCLIAAEARAYERILCLAHLIVAFSRQMVTRTIGQDSIVLPLLR